MGRVSVVCAAVAALVGCTRDAPPAPAPAASRVKVPAEPPAPAPEAEAESAFALYLLRDDAVDAATAAGAPLDELRLQDAPLLTADDVASYDWDAHLLVLTETAADRLPRRVPTGGTPFVVVAAGERIYLGAFWTSLSSQSFDHPIIDVDRRSDGPSLPFSVAIERGYPAAPADDDDTDPRNDDRLWDALHAADKLSDLPSGEVADGDTVVRWLDDDIYLRGRDGTWRALPRPAAAYDEYSAPRVARAGRFVTVALPQPDSEGHPLVEFLTTRDEGRSWSATVAVASMWSSSIEPGDVRVSVTRRGRIRATVEWSQGRECAVTYRSRYAGRAGAGELTLLSESEI